MRTLTQCRENDAQYTNPQHNNPQSCASSLPNYVAPSYPGYANCCGKTCGPGYYKVKEGLDKFQCLEYCPPNFIADPETMTCNEAWYTIAYQVHFLAKIFYQL